MRRKQGAASVQRKRPVIAFREEAAILTGARRGLVWLMRSQRPAPGEPVSVEADWQWALEREERCGDVLGFYHTHPPAASAAPSARDARTMRAWCGAFGKPLLCVIVCGSQVQATLFAAEEDAGRTLPIIEAFAGGIFVAVEER